VISNIEKIQQAMPAFGCGAMLVTAPANRLFATGFESSDGALLITAGDAWFFTDSRYIEDAGASVRDARVGLVANAGDYYEQIRTILEGNGITALGFEDAAVSYTGYLNWKEKLGVELIAAQKLIDDLRMIKSPHDLEKLIKAQRISEKSFEEIIPLISTNITEKELAAELVYRLVKNGADDKTFDPIIVSGAKSSMPHGVPGDNKITKGFLTIDYGARLDGWCSDTTRTLCIGAPDEEMKRIYDTVLEAQEAGISAARAGVNASDVDGAARTVIENAGYGEYFGHGFGHGLGLEVHEPPRAAKTSKEVLAAGMVISAEPGIYLPGRFGVRIEDVLFITDEGCENITKLAKELIIL